MKELYGDEVMQLYKLGQLLQTPERYGVTFDRGTDPEAIAIIEAALPVLLDILERKRLR